jgi:hypothetical protein
LDIDNFIDIYSLARLFERRMPMHPIGNVTFSRPCSLLICRLTEKKYL